MRLRSKKLVVCKHFCVEHPQQNKTRREKKAARLEAKEKEEAKAARAGARKQGAAPVPDANRPKRHCGHTCPIHPRRTKADHERMAARRKWRQEQTAAKRAAKPVEEPEVPPLVRLSRSAKRNQKKREEKQRKEPQTPLNNRVCRSKAAKRNKKKKEAERQKKRELEASQCLIAGSSLVQLPKLPNATDENQSAFCFNFFGDLV